MTLTSRYSNKYNAFVDSMYIEELCDTNDIYHFVEICQRFNYLPNFYAYVNDTKIDTTFFIYIDTENDEELDRLAELLDDMTL